MAKEWDVFEIAPGDTAPAYLATLYDAREKSIRPELDGTGTGQFAIPRGSAQATAAILAQGNLVKVRIPEIDAGYIFAFLLETGDFTLLSSDEQGGELLRFGGRGLLAYMSYGVAWAGSFIPGGDPPPADGLVRAYLAGTGKKPGQIIARLVAEFQSVTRPQSPIPLVVADFDYTLDSDGNAWVDSDSTDEFTYQVGEDGLSIVSKLIETDAITVQMGPDFDLHAWNTYGRDLTGPAFGAGIVRFEKGVNIAVELRRELLADRVVTHMLVGGETDHYGSAVLPDAATRVTKEGFVAAFGTGATGLNAMGMVELNARLRKSDRIMFPIANRRTSSVVLSDPVTIGSTLGADALDGAYLPGPPGSDYGDFWVGDHVRVHTGTADFDFTETDFLVTAITITRDDDNAELVVIPELVELPPPPSCSTAISTYLTALATGAEPTTATVSITPTQSPTLLLAWLFDCNGNTPHATDMTATFAGYTTLVNVPSNSRATYTIASRQLATPSGSYTASGTYTPGYANDGAWVGLQIALNTSATGPVQDAWAGTTNVGDFSSPLTPGNMIIMFCYAEPARYGTITPFRTIAGAPVYGGWTTLAAGNNYAYALDAGTGYACLGIYARCIEPGDPLTNYGFDRSAGYSTGCSIYLSEWSIG